MTIHDEHGIVVGSPASIGTVEGYLDLLHPKPQHLLQLARPLSRIARWNGHGHGQPVTILSHLLHVTQIMRVELGVTSKKLLLAGLLHDAHEAFTGDVSRPMKMAMRALGSDAFDEIETRGMNAVCERFAPTSDLRHELVGLADLMALGWEADEQFGAGTSTKWNCRPASCGLYAEPTIEQFLATAEHLGALNVRP